MTISALNAGLSGLSSYQFAVDVTANNIANANTEGFTPSQVAFTEVQPGGGVSASTSAPTAPVSADAPSATDLATELVNLQMYKIGYEANAKVVQTSDSLLGSLLDTRG